MLDAPEFRSKLPLPSKKTRGYYELDKSWCLWRKSELTKRCSARRSVFLANVIRHRL